MSTHTFNNEEIFRRLRDSLDRVHHEMRAVEIWADALGVFIQPIPDYEVPAKFMLPPRERQSAVSRRI